MASYSTYDRIVRKVILNSLPTAFVINFYSTIRDKTKLGKQSIHHVRIKTKSKTERERDLVK